MNNVSTIVGIRHLTWKDQPATTLYITTPLPADVGIGSSSEELFLKGNWDFKLNQKVTPVYSKGFKGKAILDRVDIVE